MCVVLALTLNILDYVCVMCILKAVYKPEENRRVSENITEYIYRYGGKNVASYDMIITTQCTVIDSMNQCEQLDGSMVPRDI